MILAHDQPSELRPGFMLELCSPSESFSRQDRLDRQLERLSTAERVDSSTEFNSDLI